MDWRPWSPFDVMMQTRWVPLLVVISGLATSFATGQTSPKMRATVVKDGQGQKTLKVTIQNRSKKALRVYPIGHATLYFELVEGKRSNLQINPLIVSNQMKVLKPSEHLVGHVDLTFLSQRLAKGKHRIRLRYGDSNVNGVYASHKWTGRSSIGTVLGPELSITITSTSAVHVHQLH